MIIYRLDEVPVNCGHCPMAVRIMGKTYCTPLKRRIGFYDKEHDCPIEEVDEDDI